MVQSKKQAPSSFLNPAEVTVVNPPYKILLAWKAPSRLYKQRNREFFTTIGAIVFLLAIILLFLKEWLLIGAIISLAFLSYVLASVPPEEIDYKITSRGVEVANKKYSWDRMSQFWFSEKWGSVLLHITYMGLPTQLQLILDNKEATKNNLKDLLGHYLIYEKPEKTSIDKAAEWLQEKIPLETEPQTKSQTTKS